MSDEQEGTNVPRIIGFVVLGLALVCFGFLGGQMVASGQDTEDAPRFWVGTSFGGTVTAYQEGESISVKSDDNEWVFKLKPETKIVSRSESPEIKEGTQVQVKYKEVNVDGGTEKIAHTLRVLKNEAAAETPTPAEGEATPGDGATPAEEATPAETPTP